MSDPWASFESERREARQRNLNALPPVERQSGSLVGLIVTIGVLAAIGFLLARLGPRLLGLL